MEILKKAFKRHFEWTALAAGLLFMALMNPYADQGISWCLFEWAGVPFCPGEGLGHSIAFIFRGDWHSAMQANILGPFAILVLLGRIGTLLTQNYRRGPRSLSDLGGSGEKSADSSRFWGLLRRIVVLCNEKERKI